jgi:aspartate/methionine/tyrosine aminotransferase
VQPNLFKLEAIFEEFEHVKGMNVLGASDAEAFSVNELLKIAGSNFDLGNVVLGYGDVKGLDGLRCAVAASYGDPNISHDNVLITVGASEAIVLALHSLIRPGDKALVCRPAYQSLYEMAAVAGANVIEYHYRGKEFAPDLAKVRKALAEKPAPTVLVLNSPHNPTGHVLGDRTLHELLNEAKEKGTRVIVDEVFLGISIGPSKPGTSAACLDSEAIAIGSLSKVYGLPGLRVGWLVGSQDVIQKCKELRYYTSLSPPSLVQQLGKIAISARSALLARTQSNVNRNYKFALGWLDAHRRFFEWVEPQGGLVMLIKLRKPARTLQFVRELAERHKVFLVPGKEGFGLPEGYLRLGLGGNPKKFRQGLDVTGAYLRSSSYRR